MDVVFSFQNICFDKIRRCPVFGTGLRVLYSHQTAPMRGIREERQMQTIQASRTYMMCARDKVVDLGEYRRSLADCWSVPTQAPAVPVLISRPRRRGSRLRRCALAMDVLASLGVVAMTAAFTFWVLAI